MHPKYFQVIELRKEGKSYREIAKIVGVSKNSVSRWCKNLKLPPSAQRILEEKNKKNKKALEEYNKLKSEKVRKENQKIKKAASSQIRSLSEYELLLVGTSLYWSEGWKKESPEKYHGISFVNSDPNMVKLFLNFLRKVMKIPEEKIKVNLRIHPNINAKRAINFWSKITKIPKEKFGISTQISRASQRKRPKNSLPYGTLKLSVHSRQKFYQIKGWIEGIIKQANIN
jgi:transcriptional regulator with XRE-family HTH domain